MARKQTPAGLVNDGPKRCARALRPAIRAEVEAEFAPRLEAAGPWHRLWLRFRIAREVRRRVRLAAPPEALYARR